MPQAACTLALHLQVHVPTLVWFASFSGGAPDRCYACAAPRIERSGSAATFPITSTAAAAAAAAGLVSAAAAAGPDSDGAVAASDSLLAAPAATACSRPARGRMSPKRA